VEFSMFPLRRHRYSIVTRLAHHLVPVIRASMDSWPADLHLAPEQTRALYLLAADVLRSSKVQHSK